MSTLVFVLDVKGVDYPGFENVDLGRITSYPWSQEASPKHLRFVPTTELSAQGESEAVLQLLTIVLHQEGSTLKRRILVLEEGQRFSKNTNFREIISEGLVFTKKILVCSQQARSFKESVQVYSPMALRSQTTL